jgi:hypothetical protein
MKRDAFKSDYDPAILAHASDVTIPIAGYYEEMCWNGRN